MPLNKAVLKQQIEAALTVKPDKPERSAAEVAQELADAIEAFIKSGDIMGISTTVSVTVATTGSATAQTGTGTGTGTQVEIVKIQ